MTSLKRKASQELTRNSVIILEPVPAPMTMMTIGGALTQVWSWCRNWCAGWFAPTEMTLNYTSKDVVVHNHIQTSESREDGSINLKRQKVRPNTSRSRSTDHYKKYRRRKIDHTGCVTEHDIRKRNDEYFAPPELNFFGKHIKCEPPRTPEPQSEDEQYDLVSRRHSVPIISPITLDSMPQKETPGSPQSPLENGISMTPQTRRPLRPKISQRRETGNSKPLDKLLESLFLTPGGGGEHPLLGTSDYKTKERLRVKEERRIKAREASIRAAKERRLTRRNPLQSLIQPLNTKWDDVINNVQRTNSFHHVITTSIGGTELRVKDFQTLLGRHAWLNDEIINSYIEWVVDAANTAANAESEAPGGSVSKVPKFIAHNSFFYENLIKKGPSSTQGLMKRKKAPGTSLMEVDSVFVPICKGSHWTVGVVRPIAKTIEYFDSMGGDPRPFVNLMRNWLKYQLGDTYVEEEWKVPRTACARQNNGYDCGVFVCTNSFCVAFGLDTSCYEERDMAMQRRNIAAILINRGFTGDFLWGNGGL